nr:MAG TPA: DNA polymerase I [Caudoviricetes sp.]
MYYTYVPNSEERTVQILVPDVNELTGEQFVALQQAKKDAGIDGPIEVTDRATPGNRFTVGAFGAPGTWNLDQLDRAARTEGRSQNTYGFEDIFDGTELHLDIETYSRVDLKKNTVYRYVEDDHWMILICSWCIGLGEIHTAYGHEEISGIPGLFDPNVRKIAHNSDFERINFSALKGLPVGTYINPEEYIDTAVLASLWGYPRSLKGFCKVVGGEAKDEAGGRLINMFSVPNRKGGRTLPEERPADWDAYVEYNRQDVISMRDNIYRLGKGFPSAEEYEAWITATRINDRGIKIDTDLAGAAHRQYEANKKRDLARVKEITGLDNPNSVQQFKGWLADQGFEMESIDKAHVAELLERDDLPDLVREAVERKQLAALSAATKYVIAQGSTNSDGRLRGTIKYSNANTGRMTGVTLSPHNLPRDHFTDAEGEHDTKAEQAAIDKLLAGVHVGSEDLKKLVRPLLMGPFTVSDYSAIEARLTAWAAGEDSVLESFRKGEDIYVATAERMGGVKAGFDRQRGKSATLGCIAEGSLVLTDRGPVPIENVGIADKVWDGVEFVRHEGVVYKGQKEVMRYGGLTATPDHKVWASFEGEPRAVRLDYAAACGAHLVRTGSSGAPVRLGEDHQSRSALHPEGLAHTDDADRMHRMRTTAMVEPGKSSTGALERLSIVQQSTRAPEVPGSNPHCGQAAVHEPPRSELEALRSKGDHLRLPIRDRSRALDSGEPWGAPIEARTRSRGQRQGVCSGEPSLGNSCTESGQSAKHYSGRVPSRGVALRGANDSTEASRGVHPGADRRAGALGCEGEAQELAGDRATVAVYDILNAGPRHRFTVSDVLVHNCGFGGGAGALLNLGGAKIYPKGTPDEVIWEGLTSLVETWRIAHPHIVSWWKQVHTAFDKGGPASRRIPVDVEIVGNDRYVWLPSGRALVYHNCRREYVQPKDRNGKPLPYRRRAWVCDAVVGNGTQRRIVGGPTQVENIIQAIGRDLLTHALVNVERAGFRTVTHVHDEIVTETTGGLTVERLSSLMCDLPDWAEGLPVEAAGYTTQRYRKD